MGLVGAHHPADRGYGVYAYLQPPTGLIVDRVVLPHFEAWWAPAGELTEETSDPGAASVG